MTQPPPNISPPPQQDQPFLDVPVLLERSQPAPRVAWFWYAVGLFLLVVMISTWAGRQSAMMANVVRMLSALSMLGIVAALTVVTWVAVRKAREEQLQLE